MKKYLLNILLALIAFFAPAKSIILTSFALILADLVLGIAAAIKQKIPITSTGLKRTVVKLFLYEISIMLAYTAQVASGLALPLVNIVGSFVALTELKSCMENLNILGGGSVLQVLVDKINQQQPPQQ